MNTRIPACLLGLVIIASTVLIEDAKGYGYKTGNGTKIKWSGEAINWRVSKVSFPSGSSFRTALVRAISRWNQAPGEFTYTYPPTWNDTSVSKNNGQTEVWASNNLDPPAVCYKWWKWSGGTAKYREADIVFDATVSWSTSTNQFIKDVTSVYDNNVYGGTRRPFVTTAMHEMGHALGLNHENRFLNIMGSDRSHLHANDGKIRAYAGEDAGNGDVFLYGQTDNILKDDLSVSHWKYWKAGGKDDEYSQHILTKIYHADTDKIVSWEWFEGVRRYNIKKGVPYKVQFTYENNGYYDKSNVKVGFYISTNGRITTLDRLFDTRTVTLKRNVPWTKKFTLTIPNEMGIWVNQTYWLGVIVDYTNSISEFAEDNNAAYIPIKIIP